MKTMRPNGCSSCFLLMAATFALSGCGGMQKQMDSMQARGTFDAGGHTWSTTMDMESGNRVQASGYPDRQAATLASMKLCSKYGRSPQFIKEERSKLIGIHSFDFNCVK